jgi:hypothetical protein
MAQQFWIETYVNSAGAAVLVHTVSLVEKRGHDHSVYAAFQPRRDGSCVEHAFNLPPEYLADLGSPDSAQARAHVDQVARHWLNHVAWESDPAATQLCPLHDRMTEYREDTPDPVCACLVKLAPAAPALLEHIAQHSRWELIKHGAKQALRLAKVLRWIPETADPERM